MWGQWGAKPAKNSKYANKPITPIEEQAIVNAVAGAAAMYQAMNGSAPDFEIVKKMVSAARFAASVASDSCAYQNRKAAEAQVQAPPAPAQPYPPGYPQPSQ